MRSFNIQRPVGMTSRSAGFLVHPKHLLHEDEQVDVEQDENEQVDIEQDEDEHVDVELQLPERVSGFLAPPARVFNQTHSTFVTSCQPYCPAWFVRLHHKQ